MYKFVSKVLVNRLKETLLYVVRASPSTFVPSRLIIDDVIMIFEHFHYLRKRKKNGAKKLHGPKD